MHPTEAPAPVARNASDTMQRYKPQTPALRKLVDTLGSDSLNSKALRGTAAGQATLRKAHAQLHRGGGASAGPEHGTTAWERFSARTPTLALTLALALALTLTLMTLTLTP